MLYLDFGLGRSRRCAGFPGIAKGAKPQRRCIVVTFVE
jgi:hypothetical protein